MIVVCFGQISLPGEDCSSQAVEAVQITVHLPLLCPDSWWKSFLIGKELINIIKERFDILVKIESSVVWEKERGIWQFSNKSWLTVILELLSKFPWATKLLFVKQQQHTTTIKTDCCCPLKVFSAEHQNCPFHKLESCNIRMFVHKLQKAWL